MTWFATLLMSIAAGFVATNGGRAQLVVARLTKELGRSEALLLSALVTSSATMALAAWLGSLASVHLGELSQILLASAAMLVASVRLLWPVRMRDVQEPTRSLGAISLVLTARQLVDAPRLIVFAAATQLQFISLVGLGGVLGAGLSLWFGWRFGDIVDRRFSAAAVRWALGFMLLVVAVLLGVDGLNISG